MVTMTDIARISGYSRATVSAVLGDKPGVSTEARDRILTVVREQHYVPNQLATSLVGKRSKLIGLVVRDIANPYFTMIADGIESLLSAQGYNTLYFSTKEDHDREVQALRTLASYRAAGVILTPVLRGVSLEHLWMFAASKTPVISIERVPGLPIDYVDFNNERAAHLATEHLIRAGHRRICYLAGPETSQSSAERARGFQLAHLRLGVPYDDARIIACGSSSADGYAAALQIYKEKSAARRPTALFCFSDLVALGVYQAAHKLGLRIPDDLSVVGCDDIDMSSILGPALTTVSFSVREVGRFVAQRMIEAVRNGRPAGGLAEVFHPRLIERDSVRIVEPAA